MPKKTKIIFIVVFLLAGLIILGVYSYFKNTSNNTTTNKNTSFYEKFNPFGTSTKTPTTTTPNSKTETQTTKDISKEASRFYKISDFAVAGAAFLEDQRQGPTINDVAVQTPEIVPSIRYVEKETGHIYQIYLDTKKTGTISNSTIPSVYEVFFDGRANSTIYRYATEDNKNITSFLATLGGGSNFLPSNILSISLSPDKNSYFSLIKNDDGVTGTTSSFDETKTSKVFTSSFSEWLPQWATPQGIYLTTKPSYLVDGDIFSLNITNGTLTKLFGGIPGLTTLANNNGGVVLYSASLTTGPKLNIFNIKNHSSIDLNTYGLPEKCVWSKDDINVYCAIPNTIVGAQYPDYWYQGLVSFNDYFVKINTNTREIITMTNSVNETPVDAINLFLSKNEDKLFFINKKDYTLWSLDL